MVRGLELRPQDEPPATGVLMFKLFDPQSKIQKDRSIIKDTDLRMVKYSRRGLISNFLMYVLCLAFEGSFINEQQSMVIVLTVGLLLATLVRGYYLFRFDAIYPSGPAAWRSKYFVATLIGASWWGVILSSFTIFMDLKGEASLMWLYTVVFFATTAHAFAPFKRFLAVYQFIGIVPAAVCTFLVGEYIGVFYGLILLFFYFILKHHCALMSFDYWERLEAQYVLDKKSMSLEEEKRDTRASVQLTKEYIQILSRVLKPLRTLDKEGDTKTSLSPRELEQIGVNVEDFRAVLSKEVKLSEAVFNVRHLIQGIVRGYIAQFEKNSVGFDISLSPALPARMLGDSQTVVKVLSTIIESVIDSPEKCQFLLEVEFIRNYEESGDLLITLSRQFSGARAGLFGQGQSGDFSAAITLPLVLAKAYAELIDGELEIDDLGTSKSKYLVFRCPLTVAEVGARPEYHRLAYKGRPLLIIHENKNVLNQKRLDLEAMGFDVQTTDDFQSAYQILRGALAAGSAIQSIVFGTSPGDEDSLQFCNELLEHNELKYIQQFVIASVKGREYFTQFIVHQSPLIHYVDKPAGFFEFENAFCSVYELEPTEFSGEATTAEADSPAEKSHILWFSLDKNYSNAFLYRSEHVSIETVSELKPLKKLLKEDNAELLVVECTDDECLQCIQAIRSEEKRRNSGNFLPIVGVGPNDKSVALLECGADHFIDREELKKDQLPKLDFWIKGGRH